MNIFCNLPQTKSRALDRIQEALARYAPASVRFVTEPSRADLAILHVVGRRDQTRQLIEGLSIPYAIIQYCLRSTQQPDTGAWLDIWQDARLVWSYLSLDKWSQEDGQQAVFNFYQSPLGVSEQFRRTNHGPRSYIIGTSGPSALTESVKECIQAAKTVGRAAFHLGPNLGMNWAVYGENINDADLVTYYNQCEAVSGLRRVEGFELPAAEGLLCGARPILFDQAHYRQWYRPWGIFIEETDRAGVIAQLVKLFQSGIEPVSDSEIREATQLFNWEWIIKGFWQRL